MRAGVWLLVAVTVGCAEDEAPPPPPQWTWANSTSVGSVKQIERAADGHMVAVRYAESGVMIERLDGDGVTVWSRRLSDPAVGFFEVSSLAVGDDGTTYLGGSFTGSLTFGAIDGDPLSRSTEPCPSGYPFLCNEAFVAAFDARGSLRWVQRTRGTRWSETIVRAVPGGLVVATSFSDPAEPEANTQVSGWLNQIEVTRLDHNGREQWRYHHPLARTSDAFSYIYASLSDMAADSEGGMVLGISYNVDPWDNYFELLKLDSDGHVAWLNRSDGGRMVVADDGDVIVVGQFNYAGVEQVGDYSLYAHRHDGATGELRWRRFLGEWQGAQVYASDVALDPTGDVVLLGFMTGGQAMIGDTLLEPTGPNDFLIVRLRGDDGWPEAAATLGFPGGDGGSRLLVFDRDDMVVSGSFSDAEFVVDGVSYVPSPESYGVFLRRGDPFGPEF